MKMGYGAVEVRFFVDTAHLDNVEKVVTPHESKEIHNYSFYAREFGDVTAHVEVGVAANKKGKEYVFINSVIKHRATGLVLHALEYRAYSFVNTWGQLIDAIEDDNLKQRVFQLRGSSNKANVRFFNPFEIQYVFGSDLFCLVENTSSSLEPEFKADEHGNAFEAVVLKDNKPYFLKLKTPGDQLPYWLSRHGKPVFDRFELVDVEITGDVKIYNFTRQIHKAKLILKKGTPLLWEIDGHKKLVRDIKGDAHLLRLKTSDGVVALTSERGRFMEWRNNGSHFTVFIPLKPVVAKENFWGVEPITWGIEGTSKPMLYAQRVSGETLMRIQSGFTDIYKEGDKMVWYLRPNNTSLRKKEPLLVNLALTKKVDSLSFFRIQGQSLSLDIGDFKMDCIVGRELNLNTRVISTREEFILSLSSDEQQTKSHFVFTISFPKLLYTEQEVEGLLYRAGIHAQWIKDEVNTFPLFKYGVYEGDGEVKNASGVINKYDYHEVPNKCVLLNLEDYIKENHEQEAEI